MRPETSELEQALNDRDRNARLHALRELKRRADAGEMPVETPRPWVNMHCHTFHSYNAHGFSPSRVAWEMYRRGLAAAGTVDFDVLDALDETLTASDVLSFRLTVGVESRVFVKEFEKDVINSPNEPGITYFMGQGFTHLPAPGTSAAATLRRMAEGAQQRNRAMVQRVNEYLQDVTIDYTRDVLPLTPTGNATERHMLQAYDLRAQQVFPDAARRAKFWAARLQMPQGDVERLMADTVQFRDMLRKKLMKYGGPGYIAPDPRNFPAHQEMADMVLACGAIPTCTWLDGTNPGESDAEVLLEFFATPGKACLNIIPDRNWNIRDPKEKAVKTARLEEIVTLARRREVPLSVGTEINSAAQPMVDHFNAPELKPYLEDFLTGAYILWGHSLLLRHGGFGYNSPQAEAAFGHDTARKNAFFREVGAQPPPHGNVAQTLHARSHEGDVKGVLRVLGR